MWAAAALSFFQSSGVEVWAPDIVVMYEDSPWFIVVGLARANSAEGRAL